VIGAGALAHFSETAYAMMRIVLALLYLSYGVQKLFGVLGGTVVPIWSLVGVAAQLELLLGSLMAIGLLTPWAAFLASGEMAAAYFIGHGSQGGLPVQNGGTPAVAFCFAFLYLATRGGGRYSVDAWLSRAR
jgi:putative oxidoreductase